MYSGPLSRMNNLVRLVTEWVKVNREDILVVDTGLDLSNYAYIVDDIKATIEYINTVGMESNEQLQVKFLNCDRQIAILRSSVKWARFHQCYNDLLLKDKHVYKMDDSYPYIEPKKPCCCMQDNVLVTGARCAYMNTECEVPNCYPGTHIVRIHTMPSYRGTNYTIAGACGNLTTRVHSLLENIVPQGSIACCGTTHLMSCNQYITTIQLKNVTEEGVSKLLKHIKILKRFWIPAGDFTIAEVEMETIA